MKRAGKLLVVVAMVLAPVAGFFVGRMAAAPSPLPDPTKTRFILVVEEDERGQLSVGGFDSSKDAYTASPDNPRRFLDPIPVDCAEALAGVESVSERFENAAALGEGDRPFFERHMLIAQHTCSFETYVRFLAAGFDAWLYSDGQPVDAATPASDDTPTGDASDPETSDPETSDPETSDTETSTPGTSDAEASGDPVAQAGSGSPTAERDVVGD